jgi:iron transport multicopper oxidase
VITLSDWYHEQISTLANYYLNNTLNSDSPEPLPYSALINDTQNLKINVQPGKTYFLRIINYACFSQMYLKFDDHNMTIIEVDGVYTEPEVVDTVYLTVAQRVGVLLTTKSTTDKNYAALAKLDETMFDGYNDTDSDLGIPLVVNPDVTAWLVYNEAKPLPPPLNFTLNELSNVLVDDFDLFPYDKMPLLTNPTQSFVMNLSFFTLDGQNRAGFNNITWLPQLTPSLFTALTTGDAATDPNIYGINANAMVLNHNEVVELVINNFDSGSHPVHIHGHNVQLGQSLLRFFSLQSLT